MHSLWKFFLLSPQRLAAQNILCPGERLMRRTRLIRETAADFPQ
jgi:hypothetical protein